MEEGLIGREEGESLEGRGRSGRRGRMRGRDSKKRGRLIREEGGGGFERLEEARFLSGRLPIKA